MHLPSSPTSSISLQAFNTASYTVILSDIKSTISLNDDRRRQPADGDIGGDTAGDSLGDALGDALADTLGDAFGARYALSAWTKITIESYKTL